MSRRPLLLLALLPPLTASPARAVPQDSLPPWEGGITASLGQPTRNRYYAGSGLAFDAPRSAPAALSILGRLGIEHPLLGRDWGLLSAAAETYAGVRGTQPTGGARVLVGSPALGLALGADYAVRGDRLSPALAYSLPLRRGGILGRGSVLRLDWVTRPEAIGLSAIVPLRQPRAGHTRPRHASVVVAAHEAPPWPAPEAPPALEEALGSVRIAALRLLELAVPPIGRPGADPERALAPLVARLRTQPPLPGVGPGPDLQVEQVVRAFHGELARAFGIAATGLPFAPGERTSKGEALEKRARQVLLDHVLLPVDRLLGQRKSGRVVPGLAAFASGNFARAVLAEKLASDERRSAVLNVFRELLATIELVEEQARSDWKDSRELWLPVQLGLLPEEHATQPQLDSLLERAVGQRFEDGNHVSYVINENLQAEVRQTIRDARDYHVLWIHDFRGLTETGQPDPMSLRYVVEAYLQALTEAVRAYDAGPRHRIPIYLIFLDQHYYEVNSARIWLDVLEHPLRHQLVLPPGFESQEAAVARAQSELSQAVAASPLLAVERAQYGEAWLENLVSVHVNVTNPADPSFRARGILPLIGIPDDLIRDHRKIVFYDVSEEDPYLGLALYTGIGVGEHYSGPTWEDRAILVQGPALISLKDQARRLLLSQGLRADQIPFPLRPRERAPDWNDLVAQEVAHQLTEGIMGQRALELHNQTGYGEKPIDVAKAMLYELMPRGSVVKIPDSLWGCSLYAALLAGSAWRGVRVLVIAPSLASAPSSWWPQMALSHNVLARLIVLQNQLGPELEAGGGMLKTGIYNPGIGVEDVLGRFKAAYANARRTPFLRRLLPIDTTIDSLIVKLDKVMAAAGIAQRAAPGPARGAIVPKLHLKANFFASGFGWDSMVTRREVAGAVQAYVGQLLGGRSAREASDTLSLASQALVEGYLASRPQGDRPRAVYYLIVGSANQDYRSMYLDGEASVLLSGRSAVVGLVDFALLASLSVWVDDLQTLDDLLPRPRRSQLFLARWVSALL